MSDNNINVTAPLHAATKQGKLVAAREVFMDGDTQTVEKEIQDINSRHNTLNTKHESLSKTVQGIAATGGASTATNVTYDNTNSGMVAENIQDAVDELAKEKADSSDVTKQLDKVTIKDEEGNIQDTPFRYIQNEEFIFAKVDAEDKLLFGIQWDGTPKFGKTSEVEDELQEQITILAERVAAIIGDEDITSTIDTINELKTFFANIENTQSLADILANLDNVAENLDKTTIKDEEGNVQDTPFKVIENEEFIKAIVDSENRVLFGIYRATGKPYYPLNDMYHIYHNDEFLWVILDAANHPLLGIKEDGTCWAAKAQWLDDIKAIKEALSSIDETLKTFQPKEDGKGLINMEIAGSFFYISNDEYIIAVVDAEDRILAGIKYDAQPYFPNHEMYSVITNEEWLYAIIDTDDKLLAGFRANDGHLIVGGIDISTFITNAIIDIEGIKERIAHLSTIDNDEYLAVETDSEGKVIGYTAPDGSHYLYKVKSETLDAKVDKEKGKSLINADVAGTLETIEDLEKRMEITMDIDGKVVSYRDSEGKKHEHNMEIANLYVSNLNLQGNSVDDISNALKASGFEIKDKIDWSDWYNKHNSALELPIPTKAIINITGVNKMPSKKLVNDKAYIEFFDFVGNYFKIKAYLNAQGASTMGDPMKSCAIDLFSDNWGGNEFEIKFGSWVAQDGFHLKAFYKDSLKSIQPICYEIGEQITSFLNVRSNRFHISSDNILMGGTGDIDNDFSQARCMPSQFPCEVYLNGVYYGLFVWSLKKNRKNYSMNKKDYTSILIDNVGGIYSKDNVDWTSAEIRNPKKLICVDGEEYDADTHMGELIGTDTVAGLQYTFSKLNAATTGTDTFTVTSVDYNASNKDMINTAKVKAIIKTCQAYKSEINSASTNEEKKKIAEKAFDINNMLAYIIFCELTYNQDGYANNAQITIFDKKVGYNIYDCDSCLGKSWNGLLWTNSLSREVLNPNDSNPLCVIKLLYSSEIENMYKTLRDNGIITRENLNKIIDDWFDRIGTEALKRSINKWNNSPSYRKATNLDEHWEPYMPLSIMDLESITSYNSKTSYSVDSIVCYGTGAWNNYYYKCIKDCSGIPPTTDGNYSTNGMYDSKNRIKKWIEKRIEFCDFLWNYK